MVHVGVEPARKTRERCPGFSDGSLAMSYERYRDRNTRQERSAKLWQWINGSLPSSIAHTQQPLQTNVTCNACASTVVVSRATLASAANLCQLNQFQFVRMFIANFKLD